VATISEALAIAIQHHQAGRLQVAEQVYRQILEADPNQADAIHLLGVIAHQIGKHEIAVEYIGRAITLKGNAVAYHNHLGRANYALRRIPEAVACYRRALELEPGFAEAHDNLGNALQDQGKLDEAVVCYRRALELKPDCVGAHNNLGTALQDQGKLDEAVACYQRAVELRPDFADAHSNLGNALKGQGKLDEAVVCHRRALELKPDCAEVYNNLGTSLQDQGELNEAVACYQRAVELKPGYVDARYNLGDTLQEVGDFRGAEACFRAALRYNSRFAVAHYRLAALLGGKLPEQDLATQRQLLEEGELTNVQRYLLHFGLAQVLDARGEYAEAAEHLHQGNTLQLSELRRAGRGYKPQEHEVFITRMIEVCTPAFFERVRGFGLESELPVFIVGLPRSGTTLIEQILASHSQIFGAGEIPLAMDTFAALGGQGSDPIEGLGQLNRQTARQRAARHLEKLGRLNPTALRIVDKMPDNYLYLGLLASLFPRAKLIHCRRDLRDVAVSCWMTPFQKVPWANDQQHIVSRFQQHQRIMEHWRKVLPLPVLEVDYEETVADLEGVARKLVAWCGLAWEPGCLEFHQAKRPVQTASAVQVRQPLFSTSVGRWKHYEQALAWLFARLEGGVAVS
jgi:tetratricopeptide (TPR) repeat protein